MDYWQQIFYRAFAETRKEFGSWSVKLGPAILVPFLLWREFGMGSVTSIAGLLEVAICVSEAYAIVFAVIYGAKLVAAGPMLLHERDETIKRLEGKKNQFRSTIQSMSIYEMRTVAFTQPEIARLNITGHIEIRSLDAAPTTMHDFKLHLLGANQRSFPDSGRILVSTGMLAPRAFHVDTPPLSREVAVQVMTASEWKMTFKDTHDNEYETPIYKYSG